MTPSLFPAHIAAKTFAALTGVVVCFQVALALGAPWGELAMGGRYPGVYPPEMRWAAVMQSAVLSAAAVAVLSRAGVLRRSWRHMSKGPVWAVVALLTIAVVLNLITPSETERMMWAPVAILMLLSALRVATTPPR